MLGLVPAWISLRPEAAYWIVPNGVALFSKASWLAGERKFLSNVTSRISIFDIPIVQFTMNEPDPMIVKKNAIIIICKTNYPVLI